MDIVDNLRLVCFPEIITGTIQEKIKGQVDWTSKLYKANFISSIMMDRNEIYVQIINNSGSTSTFS